MSRSSYLSALRGVVDTNKDLISILKYISSAEEKEVCREVPPGHEKAQIFGSCCGLVFAVSTLGIVCVPPTCGIALIIPGFFLATATGLLSAAIAIGGAGTTALGIEKRLKRLQKKHAAAVDTLRREIEKIRRIIETLKKRGYSAGMATTATLACLGQDLFDVRKRSGIDYTSSAATTIDLAFQSKEVHHILGAAGISIVTGEGKDHSSLVLQIKEGTNPDQSDDIESLITVLKSQAESLGVCGKDEDRRRKDGEVVFTVSDAALLTKCWEKDQVLGEQLDIIIEKLEEDCKSKQDIKYLILSLALP